MEKGSSQIQSDSVPTDYSNKASWYRIPEITKKVDTFFVYPTDYMGMDSGDPDYAPLDNHIKENVAKRIVAYFGS